MSRRGGLTTSSVITAKPSIDNKTLDAEYYRQRLAETQAKRQSTPPADRRKVKDDRRQEIANDLRTMTKAAVHLKWKASTALIDSIIGDMSIGKYGGL